MTTQRRAQNVQATDLPEDIQKILERQIKQEKSRKAYQDKPENAVKRAAYHEKQNAQRKMARAAMNGDVPGLVNLGFSQAQAEAMVAKAKQLAAG